MQNTKFSRQRETLLSVLRDTKVHPNADWIYETVRKEIPNISLGTVYRNLSKLSADGVIKKLDVGNGSVHFDGDISPHAHFICSSCGAITDIFNDYSAALRNDVQNSTGARVDACCVIFEGVCKDCI